ncbi:MAG: PilZ domain-containing protein [Deltaproteobacteria bacterium]|nr:PilZ domain-containing protein [Deltaproteobacteria bacterium]
MKSYLDIIHDYQLLQARASMGVPLYEEEEAERSGLWALLRGETGDSDGRRALPRVLAPMNARFSQSRGFGAGRVRDLSGGGLCLTTPAPPPALHTELLVYLDDLGRGLRFVFPVRVVWRASGALGAAFSGMPSRVAIADLRARSFTPSGVYRVKGAAEQDVILVR